MQITEREHMRLPFWGFVDVCQNLHYILFTNVVGVSSTIGVGVSIMKVIIVLCEYLRIQLVLSWYCINNCDMYWEEVLDYASLFSTVFTI